MFAQKLLVILIFLGILYTILRRIVFKKPVIEGFIEVFCSRKTYEEYVKDKAKKVKSKIDELKQKITQREQEAKETEEASSLAEKATKMTEKLAADKKKLAGAEERLRKIEERKGFPGDKEEKK